MIQGSFEGKDNMFCHSKINLVMIKERNDLLKDVSMHEKKP